MNTYVCVTYRTDQNSRAASSYHLSIFETDKQPTERLSQSGDVFNSLATYIGVFQNRADALRAVMGFISAPCKIVEFNSAAGGVSYAIQPQDARTQPDEFHHGPRRGVPQQQWRVTQKRQTTRRWR